jgi:hypothetical protein
MSESVLAGTKDPPLSTSISSSSLHPSHPSVVGNAGILIFPQPDNFRDDEGGEEAESSTTGN